MKFHIRNKMHKKQNKIFFFQPGKKKYQQKNKNAIFGPKHLKMGSIIGNLFFTKLQAEMFFLIYVSFNGLFLQSISFSKGFLTINFTIKLVVKFTLNGKNHIF